jgi:hypothetical protein
MWVKNNLIFIEDINVGKAVHGNGVASKPFKAKFIMCCWVPGHEQAKL